MATKYGFWKPTEKDSNIKIRGTNNVIGTKKTLVYYKGRAPHDVKNHEVYIIMIIPSQSFLVFVVKSIVQKQKFMILKHLA
ncbi:hypothetical protein TSUD_219480 [Trifolium subterraneum]|uniref:NAC domain-containing protein n=1 Tax=Trifolium subterraneum TaxID=3900 RepID=A0A2Z6N5U0_TRISU|nr:hypothetical protein TSUD_219480 [Trifolium subterraneum]